VNFSQFNVSFSEPSDPKMDTKLRDITKQVLLLYYAEITHVIYFMDFCSIWFYCHELGFINSLSC